MHVSSISERVSEKFADGIDNGTFYNEISVLEAVILRQHDIFLKGDLLHDKSKNRAILRAPSSLMMVEPCLTQNGELKKVAAASIHRVRQRPQAKGR
jgi:hypothetical protein